MAKVVLVTIESVGRIPLIGGDGPILVPTRMSFDLVKKLVMNGVKVNLHNQNDVHQKIRLTRTNLDENHFPPVVSKPQPKPVGKEIPQVSFEKKVEHPVVGTAEDTKEVTSEIRTLIQNEESTKETPKEEVKQVPHPTIAAMPTADPYAGMSKNQRKRARQAEAAARAAAAAASHTNEETDSQ